ncbi:MAG: 8-amino-7-oxononanoate synthase/2-amino-3-ketobutyrate coenzyme A ligase [Bellilinea sp.]|nr:MAG: 8-amino-7-oxononanoate synthase/2-amino-3-ketobutyrate coenzyme A ligase [Bellilinea sp.]
MSGLAFETPLGARVVIAGRERDYFSGTGYLGLHNHPLVIEAALQAMQRYGMSTATSRGGYGEHAVYDELERQVCAFFDAQAALYYASGYLGGMILVQGLAGHFERIFVDESAHYSLRDAARASGKPLHFFRHRDPAHLEESLRLHLAAGERPLVLTDGLFPISGEVAPLDAYLPLVQAREGLLGVDDAHGVGVLGENGRGTAEWLGVSRAEGVQVCATLSKALGGYGGIAFGSRERMGELERLARVVVAASPPPLPVAAAAAKALEIARNEPQLRRRLWENVALAREGLCRLGWELPDSPAPILCLRARPGVDLARLRIGLFERDICVAHVTSYSSTPPGGALRVAIFATHTREQIERLVDTLAKLL